MTEANGISRRQFLAAAGAAGAAVGLGGVLAACGGDAAATVAPSTGWRRATVARAGWRRRRHDGHVQLDDLERSLVPGAVGRHHRGDRHHAQDHRPVRQRGRVLQAQGGRLVAGHDLRRRAVGAPLLRGRPDRGLGHQRARGVQAALLHRPRVRHLDDARRLPGLSVRLVAGPDLLRPGHGQPAAPTRGTCCSIPSTPRRSSWRTSRSRSWPTWARRPAPRTRTT